MDQQFVDAPTDEASAAINETYYDLSTEETRKLKQLEKPEGDESLLQRWFDLLDQFDATVLEQTDALRDPSVSTDEYDRIYERNQAAIDEAHGVAQGYGMKECG